MVNRFNYDAEKIFGDKVDGISYVVREGVYGIVFNDIGQVAVIKNPVGFFYIVDLENRVTDSIEANHELIWMEPHEIANYLYEHQFWAVNEALNLR